VKVVVLVIPPPVALTVTVEFPAGVEPVVVMLRVEEQVGLHETLENDAAALTGNPDTLKETA
jgi:hypothetical protein